MRLSIIGGMALRDYWHERALSLCAVLALATVLAPLLILFGVRNGVIGNLQERLLQDPRNLELVPVGSGKYGEAFFAELRNRPDTGYVIPQTRAIAATDHPANRLILDESTALLAPPEPAAFAAAVDSFLTSIFQPVNFTASLTFCPFFPMASES